MVEQKNVQIVQRIYKAFMGGDIPAVLNLFTDDAEHRDFFSAKIPWAGVRRGRRGVEQFLKTLVEALEVEVFQPDEFIAGGDSVVVLGHERMRVRATGRMVEANWAHIWTLRDGMASRFLEYSDTAAWEAGFD